MTAKCQLGMCLYTFAVRNKLSQMKVREPDFPAFRDALDVLEHSHELGAGGVQLSASGWDAALARRLREKAEAWGMFIEGNLGLPKDDGDAERFESQIRVAGEAGVKLFRVAALGGRRYETFANAAAFKDFRERSWKSFTLAEAVARKSKVQLAIENHKDWRVDELLEILRRLGSEFVGVNLDTGNNLALLEEPMAVVEALAPFTLTSHIKDMAVQEAGDGFLLSEVPLGEGFLDLPRMVESCRKANPRVRFNLEMITRDPLRIPCLTDKYWGTFDQVPARDLAAMLRLVRNHPPQRPLPSVSGKTLREQLALEEDQNRRSITFAREHLGL